MNFVVVEERPAVRQVPAGEARLQSVTVYALPAPGAAQQKAPPRPNRSTVPPQPVMDANRRFSKRKAVKLSAQVYLGGSEWLACTVHDMSASGVMIELMPNTDRHYNRDPLPERFYLVIDSLLERSDVLCQVMWRKGDRAGIMFMGPIEVTVKKLPPRPVRGQNMLKRR